MFFIIRKKKVFFFFCNLCGIFKLEYLYGTKSRKISTCTKNGPYNSQVIINYC